MLDKISKVNKALKSDFDDSNNKVKDLPNFDSQKEGQTEFNDNIVDLSGFDNLSLNEIDNEDDLSDSDDLIWNIDSGEEQDEDNDFKEGHELDEAQNDIANFSDLQLDDNEQAEALNSLPWYQNPYIKLGIVSLSSGIVCLAALTGWRLFAGKGSSTPHAITLDIEEQVDKDKEIEELKAELALLTQQSISTNSPELEKALALEQEKLASLQDELAKRAQSEKQLTTALERERASQRSSLAQMKNELAKRAQSEKQLAAALEQERASQRSSLTQMRDELAKLVQSEKQLAAALERERTKPPKIVEIPSTQPAVKPLAPTPVKPPLSLEERQEQWLLHQQMGTYVAAEVKSPEPKQYSAIKQETMQPTKTLPIGLSANGVVSIPVMAAPGNQFLVTLTELFINDLGRKQYIGPNPRSEPRTVKDKIIWDAGTNFLFEIETVQGEFIEASAVKVIEENGRQIDLSPGMSILSRSGNLLKANITNQPNLFAPIAAGLINSIGEELTKSTSTVSIVGDETVREVRQNERNLTGAVLKGVSKPLIDSLRQQPSGGKSAYLKGGKRVKIILKYPVDVY